MREMLIMLLRNEKKEVRLGVSVCVCVCVCGCVYERVMKVADVKADSHLLQRSAFSSVDCINKEIESFPSLCRNETVHRGIRTSVNKLLR